MTKAPGRNEPCLCGSGRKYKKCCGGISGDTLVVFGAAGREFGLVLADFARKADRRVYRFMPSAEYDRVDDLRRRQEIYWTEILYRAHFGASSSLLRINDWLKGANLASEAGNALLLAAGLRGLIEALADSYQAFGPMPLAIAECHVFIRKALRQELEIAALVPDVENRLIHFTHARRLRPDEIAPPTHAALESKTYIGAMSEEVPGVAAAYSTLCQYTHPSALSLSPYWGHEAGATTLDSGLGGTVLRELLELSQILGGPALAFGVNPCIALLRVLNEFALPDVHTPWKEPVEVLPPSVWQQIKRRLDDPTPPSPVEEPDLSRVIDDLRVQGTPVPRGRPARTKLR